MIPCITVITTNHRSTIIWTFTRRTNPNFVTHRILKEVHKDILIHEEACGKTCLRPIANMQMFCCTCVLHLEKYPICRLGFDLIQSFIIMIFTRSHITLSLLHCKTMSSLLVWCRRKCSSKLCHISSGNNGPTLC